MISLMTVDEFAAYWGLVKAFDHLSMAGDGETRDPNPEVCRLPNSDEQPCLVYA